MAYDVTVERLTVCPTAVVRADTTWQAFPALWPTLLGEVWSFLRTNPDLHTDGHNVMLYRRDVPGIELRVEVGVQVTRPFDASGRVVASALPPGEAATTIHTGSPAEVGSAHAAVRSWCNGRGRDVTGISWEVYGDPDARTGHFDIAVYWELIA